MPDVDKDIPHPVKDCLVTDTGSSEEWGQPLASTKCRALDTVVAVITSGV